MSDEDAIVKIKNYLNTSKKLATDIFNTYNTIYGATSAWDMCNAISYVAKGLDVDTRCAFEAKCL